MALVLHEDFDIRLVVSELDRLGGVSLPILPKATRSALLAEAITYPYARAESVVGPAQVHQDFLEFDAFPVGSSFLALRDRFQQLLRERFAILPEKSTLFPTPLHFDDLVLQRYEPGSFGISPHRDALRFVNLVCVFTLLGQARFSVCEDRDGTNPADLDASPGTVILLRAPGFRGSRQRPFHRVSDIRTLRIAFGLRQRG